MIKTSVEGTQVIQRLRGLRRALDDLRPIWADVHTIFIEFMKRRFATEGVHGGKQWAPLSDDYARWKSKNFPGKSLLQLRGRLYNSLTEQNHIEHVYRVGPSWAEFGTSVPYAVYHQTGTRKRGGQPRNRAGRFSGSPYWTRTWTRRPKIMPARPIMANFTKMEGEEIVDVVMAYLLSRARTS